MKASPSDSRGLVAVRFNGHTPGLRYHGITQADCRKPRRWLIRAQLWCRDQVGEPVRVSSTVRAPRAVRLSELVDLVADLLADLGQNDAKGLHYVAGGWLAVSES